MERPVGRDARVERTSEWEIGAALRSNKRLHVGNFEIGRVDVRMQHGVRVKSRIAARRGPGRGFKCAAQRDARVATLELRTLDGDLRRRNHACSRDRIEAHNLRCAGAAGRQLDGKLRGLDGARNVRPDQ